ncbi:LamG domain-containing protein [Candidatus Poribacteria bacterium]|nr:LamG domain-containing protein [Candidatus Poribacteria bacterium]
MFNLKYIGLYIILNFLMIGVFMVSVHAQDEHTVLLYTFETGKGDTVKDHSGKGNDGKLMGTNWGAGKFRTGLELAGNEKRDFIEVADSESLDLVEGLTIEMWVYLNAHSTAGGTGVTKESTYKFGPRNDSKILHRMVTTEKAWGAAVVISNAGLPLKKWIHIAGTYDAKSGDGIIYIDGNEDNKGNIGGEIVPNNDVLWIGRGAGPFLDGMIDEVRISNKARTKKEVNDLMNNGIEGVLAVTPNDKLSSSWGRIKTRLIE